MFRLTTAALGALLLSGVFSDCSEARLEHPLSAPEQARADPRLEGTWAGRNDQAELLLEVGSREGGLADAVLTGRDPGKGVGLLAYQFFPTALGGRSYLNLREKKVTDYDGDKYELGRDYLLVRYELKGDTLSLWYLGRGAAEKGGLHRAEGGQGPFTDDSAALAAWVQKAPPEAWERFAVLKKQKLDLPRVPAAKKK